MTSKMKEDGFSIRPKNGQMVEVYDGRKWPVVRCGSVYITPSDSTHKVTQTVLSTPNVHEKKRRASKYTVAVGTTHGHVQSFLKDSDLVLSALDQCPAEEKCLLLIRRPKDASKKLLKTQAVNNLSMSDTQLYRHYDGTALNNPYSAHRMKNKTGSNSDVGSMTSEIYSTEPRVRKAGQAANSRYTKKTQAPRTNAFVPIPELGIYTPEQHVLQNGTYAQHCHLREVNNNKKNRGDIVQNSLDNISSTTCTTNTNANSSFNSSFDESVNSYGMPPKGVLRGFDSGYHGQAKYASGEVYHSCLDISNVQRDERDFSTLNSQRSYENQPIRQVGGGARNTNSNRPIREQDRDDSSKMDANARSHSLGDLTTGLTFSLVGQKKADSVVSVSDTSKKEMASKSSKKKSPDRGSKSPDRANDNEGSSALKHIRERLQRAVINSQSRISAHSGNQSSNGNTTGFKTVYEETPNQALSKTNSTGSDTYHYNHHQYDHQSNSRGWHHPQQQQSQNSRHQQQERHQVQQHMLRQQSAPEGHPQPVQSVSSPRRRRDSEDTTSSYRSAVSDVRLSQDLDNVPYNNTNNLSSTSSSHSNNNNANNNSNSSNSMSTLNNSNSSGNSYSTANSQSTITSSRPVAQSSGNTSPTKPKRSLPNVPLSETSERIKRFTEMMKSRMSSGSSASRNYSADSMNSKHTPSRMSSVESTCSQNSHGHSRKSSLDTVSDGEVFTITNNNGYPQRKPDKPQQFGSAISKDSSIHHAQPLPYKPQENGYHEKYYDSKAVGSVTNNDRTAGHSGYSSYDRKKSSGNDVDYQDSRAGHNNYHHSGQSTRVGSHGYGNYENQPPNGYVGQGHGTSTSEETPLPPGDRSTDSGQTTGTNHSYNGSALDSGYTTNNDGENDSFNSLQHHHHHHHQQQQQYQQPHQSHHVTSQQHYHPSQQHQPQQNNHQPPPRPRDARDELPKFAEQNFNDYYNPSKKYSNLANAHRFGSVQNISSAQAHGNPKDFTVCNDNQYTRSDKYPQPGHFNNMEYPLSRNDGPYSAREISANQNTRGYGSAQPLPIKGGLVPVNNQFSQWQNNDQHMPANRRSWDYADVNSGQSNTGFSDNRLKRTGKTDERYRSTEVISSTKGYFDGNYVNTAHLYKNEDTKTHPFQGQYQQGNANPRNVYSKNENGQLNNAKEFAPLMAHSYHGDLNSQRPQSQHKYNGHNYESSTQNSKSTTSYSQDTQSAGYRPQRNEDNQWNAEYYKRNTDGQAQGQSNDAVDKVRPRPVPVARANRLARGHTLPGGFRFNDVDSNLSHLPNTGQDIALFHMTQKYDLAPLLINLPTNLSLKDVLELKEFSVEISMVGVPGLPSSPQGQAPKIGSPGSAFTPVKNSQDQDASMTARLKVICFARVREEVHKHTTLGRVLEGDIVVEVNGWFCLGADVPYLKRIVENCQGAITFTVARVKESDEKRYKGQTPAERIKSLESEISRLDELIQSRDSKIRELTSSGTDNKQHTGTLSDVNGKIPVEGMVIGDDEYVV